MSLFARTGIARLNPVQGGATGMRVVATGLLVLMACVYLAAKSLQATHPGWAFVRAFAEAAMVGGLADWFAVTALFRHPLGLPIPHTAIIPRNKDRIGDTLALFLKDNFLTPSVVARRMRKVDVASAAGRFLGSPDVTGEGKSRQGVSKLVATILDALDQQRLGGMVKAAIGQRLRALDVAPILGQALEAAMKEGRHLPLQKSIIDWAGKTLEANEDIIRGIVHERANKLLRWTGLDEDVANAIIKGLNKMLAEMADDPEHPLRAKVNEAFATLASNLQRDKATKKKVEDWKAVILENPALQRWLDGLWEQARAGLLKATRDPEAALAGKFGETLRQLGLTLQEDRHLATTINRFARRAAVGATASYGDGIVRLVSDTVRGWDADTVTGRLESAVGRDLQYIRVNGTLVGGLVGLTIHMLDLWL